MNTDYKEQIRQNLTKYRKLRGLSKSDMAKSLNVSKSTMTNWEKGKHSIDLEMFFKICDLLDVSADDMAGRDIIKHISTDEKNIIAAYRSLSPGEQTIIRRSLDLSEKIGEWESKNVI